MSGEGEVVAFPTKTVHTKEGTWRSVACCLRGCPKAATQPISPEAFPGFVGGLCAEHAAYVAQQATLTNPRVEVDKSKLISLSRTKLTTHHALTHPVDPSGRKNRR